MIVSTGELLLHAQASNGCCNSVTMRLPLFRDYAISQIANERM
jgi:hypothetical protein